MELRAQKSALLGFETHAAFVLEMNMAKDCKTVAAFLGEARESAARAAGGQRGLVSRETGGGRGNEAPCLPRHLLAAQGWRTPFSRDALSSYLRATPGVVSAGGGE